MRILHKIKECLCSKKVVPIYINIPKEDVLKGKTALVVGGCGGIGKAIARSYKNAGCDVIISGTNKKRLEDTGFELGVKTVLLDLTDISQIPSSVNEALSQSSNDRIDILVNSAGINIRKNFLDFTEDDFDKVMRINVKGLFFITQYIAQHMIEKGIKGHILNISSSSALRPAWSPYRIAKAITSQMTQGFAEILLPHGIVVNAIGPGPTATSMMGYSEGSSITFKSSPSGRYATPEEVAYLATYLVSDMANLVVGDTIYISGGSGTISYER